MSKKYRPGDNPSITKWVWPELNESELITDLPECVLYEAYDFQSGLPPIRTNTGCLYFAQNDPWNDAISSIIIVRGTWTFFQDHYLTGPSITLGPNYYPNLKVQGWDDRITSFSVKA